MKSIITTYPDFQALPKGLKKMLLASENFFFYEVKPTPAEPQRSQFSSKVAGQRKTRTLRLWED